jgi:SAM-dependent methyltransferase
MSLKDLIPRPLRPPLRETRRAFLTAVAFLGTIFRARAFRNPDSPWLRLLGRRATALARLNAPPRGLRKIEIGSGGRPRPGYIHVDVLADSPHLDLLASGRRLPLPDGWADEVLAVHMIEHVPPPKLRETFREWSRVLKDGGVLQVHTPNGGAFAQVLMSEGFIESGTFWAIQNAMFGYGGHPRQTRTPESLGHRGDHRALFTFRSLQELLQDAGFSSIRDISGEDPCHHFVDWAPDVPRMCLEVIAAKDGLGSSGPRER